MQREYRGGPTTKKDRSWLEGWSELFQLPTKRLHEALDLLGFEQFGIKRTVLTFVRAKRNVDVK
jgi:hypothetical protein